MRNSFLFLLLSSFLFYSCYHKKLIISEISPNIVNENVYTVADSKDLLKIISDKSYLYLIFKDGKIVKLDSKSFLKVSEFKCISGFRSKIKYQHSAIKNSTTENTETH